MLGNVEMISLMLDTDAVPYENTCRPGNCKPATCAFRNPCDYDGGAHTEPRYEQSALLVLYR